MYILPHLHTNLNKTPEANDLIKMLLALRNPTFSSHSVFNYASVTQNISKYVNRFARSVLRKFIHDIDSAFKNAPGRTTRYYIKSSNASRTIKTVFGQLHFTRTQYQDRATKKMYYHVDTVLGLPKYDHYDPLVKSMIVELYAEQNSMIKVGKIIGDRINFHYNLDSDRKKFATSRQTVYNTIKKAKKLVYEAPKAAMTPENIFIMADEKFIPLQRENKDRPSKLMVKMASIFDGKSTANKRTTLLNKYSVATETSNFWPHLWEVLNQRYNLDKVKQINILGDGANWIKAGVNELRYGHITVSFSLDKFHTMQAINRITKDSVYKELLIHYMIKNMKKDFICVVDIIRAENPKRDESISQQATYLLNNWKAIQNSYHKIKMGCSMEAEISHVLASSFTSVPKAYARQNLSTYLNYRMNAINGIDLRHAYLESQSMKVTDNTVYFKESYDFSIFEPSTQVYQKASTSNFIKGVISKN